MSEFNIEVQGGSSVRLPTAGKYCEKDIIVIASGGTEEFVGVKLSDFSGTYTRPKVADIRSLTISDSANQYVVALLSYLFANSSTSANSGYYTSLEKVYLPQNFKNVSPYMFWNCINLKTLIGVSLIDDIADYAFGGCVSLTEFPHMPNLKLIRARAFEGCSGLTEVKFYNTLTSLANNAFSWCSNLTDIYCPWSEGAVTNAPWGATNATIHYNTIYDENGNPII